MIKKFHNLLLGDYMLQDIINLITNNKLLFLAGAGISMDAPSNLPSAKQIMDIMIDYGALEEYKTILKAIDGIRYEYVVQVFRDRYDKELQFLNYFTQKFVPNNNHYTLAQQILMGNIVITTNFDSLIEQALINLQNKKGLAEKPPKAIITEKDFLEYTETLLQDQSVVFKLHGAPLNYFTGQKTVDSIITTLDKISVDKDKRQEIFSLPLFKQHVIQHLDDGRILLVLGYGGGDTFDIIPEIELMGELVGLVWIDHKQQRIDKNDWIITDHRKRENNTGAIDLLLSKISKNKHIPVYKLQGHTGSIIQYIFHTTSLLATQTVVGVESFSNWLQQALKSASAEKQYYFTEKIFRNYQKFTEGLQVLEQMKYWAENQADKHMQSYCLNNMGSIYQDTDQPQKALELYQQAYTIDKELDDQQNMAVNLSNMGSAYQDTGQPQKALECLQQAYIIDKELNDQQHMAIQLSNMGVIYQNIGQPQKALELYQQAYAIDKELGNQQYMAIRLNNIGSIYKNTGKYQQALEFFQQAYAIDKELNNQQSIAIDYISIGSIYKDTGKYQQALEFFQQAHIIDKKLNSQQNIAIDLISMGSIYDKIGQSQQALELYQQAYAIDKELNNQQNMATCLSNMGLIYKDAKQYQQALELFQQAYIIDKQLNNQQNMAICLNNMGSIYEDLKQSQKALEFYQQAYAIDKELNNRQNMATDLNNMGSIYG